MKYIDDLQKIFEANSNVENAYYMKKYMKNKFEFLGIKKPLRDGITKELLKRKNLPKKSELFDTIIELNSFPFREYHQFTLELMKKFVPQFDKSDIEMLEFMIISNSWWDTVDIIATRGVGGYFSKFPEMIEETTNNWMDTNYLWLQRTCLIFQLFYKEKTDKELLAKFILMKKDDNEFFIRKAIGWALRHYSRTNPKWVVEFTEKAELTGLSKREALRLIK